MRKANNTLAVLHRKNDIIMSQKREIKRLSQLVELGAEGAKMGCLMVKDLVRRLEQQGKAV